MTWEIGFLFLLIGVIVKLSDLQEMMRVQGVEVQKTKLRHLPRPVRGVSGIRLNLAPDSSLLGRSLREIRFREKFGAVMVAIRRDEELLHERLADTALRQTDKILAVGTRPQLEELGSNPAFEVQKVGLSAGQQLQEHLFLIRIPEGSPLAGTSVGSSRIGELVGVTVGGIIRGNQTRLAVPPAELIQEGDRLLVAGEPSQILSLLELGEVELDSEAKVPVLESVGVMEAMIAPRSDG